MNAITPATLPTIPLVVHGGEVFATSRIVADFFDKQHKNVLQAIECLDCSDEFNELNFQPVEYLDMKGEVRPMYELTRDGFMFLAMGFTGPRAAAVKEAFIAQFNQMEFMLRGGAALPALTQAATQTQVLVAQLAERVVATEEKIDAVLTLVDVAGKYISLLEGNQKQKRRAVRPITANDEVRIKELLEQGMPGISIAEYLGVSTATVSRIKNGSYIFRRDEGNAAADHQSSLI